jgi:hypothetical protein
MDIQEFEKKLADVMETLQEKLRIYTEVSRVLAKSPAGTNTDSAYRLYVQGRAGELRDVIDLINREMGAE